MWTFSDDDDFDDETLPKPNNSKSTDQKVWNLVESVKCRRLSLLQHFDPNLTIEYIRETCCDLCEHGIHDYVPANLLFHDLDLDEEKMLDVTDDTRDIIELVKFGKMNRTHFLASHEIAEIADFLCGTYFEGAHGYPLRYFGKGSKKSRSYWTELLEFLSYDFCWKRMLYFNDNGLTLTYAAEQFRYVKSLKMNADPICSFPKTFKRNDRIYEVRKDSNGYTYKWLNEKQMSELELE